jgi:hypothetical protein
LCGLLVPLLGACVVAQSSATVYRTSVTGQSIPTNEATNAPAKHENVLAGAGLITLGAGYVGTVVGGQFSKNVLFNSFDHMIGADVVVDKLWIPVIGPWLGMAYYEDTVRANCIAAQRICDSMNIWMIATAFGGVVQTTGVIMIAAGVLSGGHRPIGKALVVVPQSSGIGIAGWY